MIAFKWCVFFIYIGFSLCMSVDLPMNKTDNFAKFISKLWKHCMKVPILSLCLKQRSLLELDNLIKSNDVIKFPGEMISLVKNQHNLRFPNRILSEEDLEKHLPKDVKLQEKTLNLLLESAYSKFLSSRSIQIRLPTKHVMLDKNEGRGDKKKGNGFATGAMMAAMMMIPMALAGIGLLAGKALIVSMLALMMSALIASRKSQDSGHSSYEVISVPAGGHHHGRRLSVDHDLPYNAHETQKSLNVETLKEDSMKY